MIIFMLFLLAAVLIGGWMASGTASPGMTSLTGRIRNP